jgi:hypothetical protein
MLISGACMVMCALVMVPETASAQVWDSPSFFSPRPGEDIGAYAFKPDNSDWGFEGIWRQEGNINLGVRAGITGNSDFFVGSEFYNALNITGSPLLMSWVLGAGATFGDATLLRIPFGVSAGVQLNAGSLQILPYAHPRVAFDLLATDDDADSESEFNFDLDVGADIGLTSQFVARVGATVTNGGAFGLGLAYRMPRRVVVR